jgi:hypothetical protein
MRRSAGGVSGAHERIVEIDLRMTSGLEKTGRAHPMMAHMAMHGSPACGSASARTRSGVLEQRRG